MGKIVVVGGINIDVEGRPFEKIKYQDSNPGKIKLSFGGVGRNITENLARMGEETAMLAVIGDDDMGKAAKEELRTLGVDVSGIEMREGMSTAMYLAILNNKNDMELGLCDMDIIDYVTEDFLERHMDKLKSADVIAVDGNLKQETLEYVAGNIDKPIFFDPVSSLKGIRGKKVLGRFEAIKPNVIEAEALLDMEIKDEADVILAANKFHELGVKKVFITLNKDGVYYSDGKESGFLRPGSVNLVSATGAGDAFSSAILKGLKDQIPVGEIAKIGMVAAGIAMEAEGAVNKNITIDKIKERI